MTDIEYGRKQIDNLLNSHAEVLQTWKGFEIIGRPAWQGMRGHRCTYSGFDACIIQICTGKLEGMAIIRTPGGESCVGLTALRNA